MLEKNKYSPETLAASSLETPALLSFTLFGIPAETSNETALHMDAPTSPNDSAVSSFMSPSTSHTTVNLSNKGGISSSRACYNFKDLVANATCAQKAESTSSESAKGTLWHPQPQNTAHIQASSTPDLTSSPDLASTSPSLLSSPGSSPSVSPDNTIDPTEAPHRPKYNILSRRSPSSPRPLSTQLPSTSTTTDTDASLLQNDWRIGFRPWG